MTHTFHPPGYAPGQPIIQNVAAQSKVALMYLSMTQFAKVLFQFLKTGQGGSRMIELGWRTA